MSGELSQTAIVFRRLPKELRMKALSECERMKGLEDQARHDLVAETILPMYSRVRKDLRRAG